MTRKMRLVVITCTAAAFLLLAQSVHAQRGGWWDPAWKARRIVRATIPAGVEADEPVAVAKFMTHGMMKPDGSDVRVISRETEVPCRVLHVGPGDKATLAFQLLVGVETYQVYYGNPKANSPTYDWEICAGLLLEVKKYEGGGVGNLGRARDAWKRAKKMLGVDFVPNVYFGHNPFGGGAGFISRYSGWLTVETEGRYRFSTTSSNASFLLINDKQVVSWPGIHGPSRRARRTGSVDLKPGRHKFEFFHVHPYGRVAAVVGWQPPKARRPVVIPASAFLPVARATVQSAEVYRRKVTPDFDFKQYEAFLKPNTDRLVHRFAFSDVTGRVNRKYYRPLWDFGDGITSTVWMPSHVYLSPGDYTVTYHMKGIRGSFTTKQIIRVERDWAMQSSKKNVEKLAAYYLTVSRYDFRKMPAGSIAVACEMFERLRKDDDLIRAAKILLSEKEGVRDKLVFDATERLVAAYLDRRKSPTEAVETYLGSEKRMKTIDWRAAFANRAGWIALTELNDTARARECFGRVLNSYAKAKGDSRRRAMVGLAEVAIISGDAEEVRKKLREAAAIPVGKSARGGEAVRVGSLSRAIEDYIRRKEHDLAEELLDAWEWEYPLDRLVGYSTVLRAKLHISRGEFTRAIRLLTSLVKVNPGSNYAAESLLIAGDCYARTGDKAKARDTYKRILGEYPESPGVKDALSRIESVK